MEFVLSRRFVIIATAIWALVVIFRLMSTESLQTRTKCLLNGSPSNIGDGTGNTYGLIKDKVAVITDTQYTPRLIPLILHYHAVLGPDWPIIFYTAEQTIKEHFQPDSKNKSAIWQRAVDDGRIQLRVVPSEFNLTDRNGVNIHLSRPWLWEDLAPAKHVLIFQTDAILCANSHHTMDEFLEWDFIGAPVHDVEKLYNGGLSLRNRELILQILNEGENWEEQVRTGKWNLGGEDIWFSKRMDQRKAHLPGLDVSLTFAGEFDWNYNRQKEPLGFHKVHKNAASKVEEIAKWCPEIALAAPGNLK
ncbi:hypothetical protein F5884DRAFT_114028 [Xylogone sp. PMI_703]|nr:hypothetical protein F5884DRAFT_114028 [Xylogone sp. PMI_703]